MKRLASPGWRTSLNISCSRAPLKTGGKFSQVVARIGGQENAFTSQDYTGYFQRVPSDQLKTIMEFEADRMTGLELTDDVVLPERNVILEEQNQRVGNNPRARLTEQIEAALFLNHPYGRPVIGWRHEMESCPRGRARVLQALLRAQQRRCGHRRRRRAQPRRGRLAENTYGMIAPRRNSRRACGRKSRRRRRRARLTLADARVEIPAVARVSRAVFLHGEARRKRSARSAGAHSRRRLEQPALSAPRRGQGGRGQRRRLYTQLARSERSPSTARRARRNATAARSRSKQ